MSYSYERARHIEVAIKVLLGCERCRMLVNVTYELDKHRCSVYKIHCKIKKYICLSSSFFLSFFFPRKVLNHERKFERKENDCLKPTQSKIYHCGRVGGHDIITV